MTEAASSATWALLRSALFRLDAETAHHLALFSMSHAPALFLPAPGRGDIARHPSLAREVLGIPFPNLFGLAAGLDKNAEAPRAWQSLGFGFIEVGTITAKAQPGNPRPRLFRLRDDGALLNRMGFNNEGADVVGRRLAAMRDAGGIVVPVGVNLGKSKVTPLDEAHEDYRYSFERTAPYADYVVVNVSSPNTPGLRDLQQRDDILRLLEPLVGENEKLSAPRPLLLKLAPDLHDDDALSCAEAAADAGCRGIIVSNTTLSREGLIGPVPEGGGGISGRPLAARSTELLATLADALGTRLTMVGVGGVMDAGDAQAKLDAGADLVQGYSGFIYGGPRWPRQVLEGLVERAALA